MIFFPHISLHIFCQIFPALRLFFFPNFPGPTFIQGPFFILFAKSSRPYAYSHALRLLGTLEYSQKSQLNVAFNSIPPI